MSTATAARFHERLAAFELRAKASDGLTFEGYAAVYNSPTRIADWDGDYDEVIAPGAFDAALRDAMPVLMFEHGRHPLLGSMPLGTITAARSDSKGLFITARLTDNWLIQPVRDAVRDGGVSGMSFRFSMVGGAETWARRPDDVDLRTITQFGSVPELGPVVFPAYAPTTAAIRSLMPEVSTEVNFTFTTSTNTDHAGRSEQGSDGGDEKDTKQPGAAQVSPAPRGKSSRHAHAVARWLESQKGK